MKKYFVLKIYAMTQANNARVNMFISESTREQSQSLTQSWLMSTDSSMRNILRGCYIGLYLIGSRIYGKALKHHNSPPYFQTKQL